MRVFHILSNPAIGGIVRMLSVLVPPARRAGVDMQVVNLADTSTAYALWDRAGVPYHRLPTPPRFLLGGIPGLTRLLRRQRPDVVEIYGLRANVVGRIAARLAGVPVILTGVISTDDWRRWHHVWLDRLTRPAVTRWVCNSRACARSLVEREKHPAGRLDVIYDAIDTARWTPAADPAARSAFRRQWGWPEDAVIGVTVANLRPDKGIEYLIEAASGVVEAVPQARFLLAGADEMNGRLQRRVGELGLEKVIAFAGFQDDIRRLYDACDVAVLPSLREGLPICLIEAMCMELPVVATAVSGTPELVDDPATGLLVPPRDVAALRQALVAVMSDPRRRADMGRAGREKVLKTFRIERMVDELIRYYGELLRRTPQYGGRVAVRP